MMIRSAVAAVVVAGGIALPAAAESVQVKIADNAPYEQSLVCYQFHGVSGQIMQAASQSGEVEGEQEQTVPAVLVEARQSLWWYLLILAFLLLVAETALSNRMSAHAS